MRSRRMRSGRVLVESRYCIASRPLLAQMTSKPSISSSSFIVEQMSSASSRIRIRLAIDVTAAFAFVRIAVVGDRQSHHEASALSQFALDTDRTPVRFDDATSDEKPKPQSADVGRGTGTFESLEKLALL